MSRTSATILDMNLTLLSAPGAVCLDGSPGGFYYAPARSPTPHSWVIELQGGGWCYTPSMCSHRGQTWSRSGAWTPSCRGAGPSDPCKPFGPLAADPEINPEFATFHRVHIQYCDGGAFSGDHALNTSNGTLYFRGRRILQATIETLRTTYGLGSVPGTEVLLTGCSAGGHAVYLNADYIRGLLPPTVSKFKAMAGSGFMIDRPNAEGDDVFGQEMAGVCKLARTGARPTTGFPSLVADAPPDGAHRSPSGSPSRSRVAESGVDTLARVPAGTRRRGAAVALLPRRAGVTWLSHGRHTAVTWLLHGCHVVVIWLLRGCYVTVTWLSCGCHVAVMWRCSLPGRPRGTCSRTSS